MLRCCNSQRLGGAGVGDITGNREGAPEWQGENQESTASVSQERDMHGEGGSGQFCWILLRIWWEDDRKVPLRHNGSERESTELGKVTLGEW